MSTPSEERPQVRSLEATPLENGSFLIQDPSGLMASPLEVSRTALQLLACCDGTRTRDQVVEEFQRRTGGSLERADLDEFLKGLDEAGVLESQRLQARRQALEEEFRLSEWRLAAHAGGAYEADRAALVPRLDELLQQGNAPRERSGPLRALVAPHIDLHRGGRGYGRTYATLRHCEAPEVVVLLGTAHAPTEGRFVLCDKGFETPCGRLPVDRPFLDRLRGRLGGRHENGVMVHKHEHSIEFQALFLAHLFPESPPAIVPILCTSLDDCMQNGGRPEDLPEVAEFLGALAETWTEETRRVLMVVGADLSHVGPRFGDPAALEPEFLRVVRERDLEALEAAATGGAKGFFRSVARHGNRHRICSVASIYTALATVGPSAAELLDYDQAVDEEGRLAVSYAGLALTGPPGGPGLRWHS